MKLLDYLFPVNYRCLFCGKEDGGVGICDECKARLPYITGNTCEVCGIEVHSGNVCIECKSAEHKFDKCFCIMKYVGGIKHALQKFKLTGYKNIGKVLAELMKEYFDKIDIPFDMIIPVPNHPSRLKERKFNHLDIMLERIEESYGRVYKNLLIRIKDTPHQTGLDRERRKINLKSAFKVTDKSRIKHKTILLVDDIFTTGSTLDECAHTLRKAGADRIFAMCLCRSVIPDKKIFGLSNENTKIEELYI